MIPAMIILCSRILVLVVHISSAPNSFRLHVVVRWHNMDVILRSGEESDARLEDAPIIGSESYFFDRFRSVYDVVSAPTKTPSGRLATEHIETSSRSWLQENATSHHI